jgi:hypothetical protein
MMPVPIFRNATLIVIEAGEQWQVQTTEGMLVGQYDGAGFFVT